MEKISLNQVEILFNELEIEAAERAKIEMLRYVNLLMKGMERSRLTGDQTGRKILEKHVYDSLYPLKLIDLKKESKLIDLGAGGGLPGIPIKIVRPDLSVTLLESNRKKALFLKKSINTLGLEKVFVVNKRAEEIGQDSEHREKYKYVLCRAVAKIDVLAELALPLLINSGEAVFYKGPGWEDELEKAERAVEVCGGAFKSIASYSLKSGEERKIVLIKKKNKTPEKYPRRPGIPGKKPIK